ncbi:MAG: MBG domain-containing protein, partial [Actinomycetota bacterium]
TLTVNKKSLTVTASSPEVEFGAPAPTITPSYSGWVGSDGGSSISGQACSTTYQAGDPVGTYPTSCSGGTAANYSLTYEAGTLTVEPRTTTTSASINPTSVQYSDTTRFSATVSLEGTDPGEVKGTVEFFVGSTSYGTLPVAGGAASRTVSMVKAVEDGIGGTLPADFTVKAVFTPDSANYAGSNGTTAMRVTPENAFPVGKTAYVGQRVSWTTTSTSSTATLTLAGVVQDYSSQVCPDPAYPGCDPWPGNITKAKMTFYRVDGTTKTPIKGAEMLSVGWIDPDDRSKGGTAAATIQYELKSGSICEPFTLGVRVEGAYRMAEPPEHEVEVSVCRATPGTIVGAGGSFSNAGSQGFLKADSGESQFSFDVKYNKSGTNPQGKVSLRVHTMRRPDGSLDTRMHTYQITTNAISTLTVNNATGKASFSAKANITEVIANADDGTVVMVPVDSGAILQLVLTDGKTGGVDTVGFTVQKASTKGSGGPLWFSSLWDGVKTVEKAITAGEISAQ